MREREKGEREKERRMMKKEKRSTTAGDTERLEAKEMDSQCETK